MAAMLNRTQMNIRRTGVTVTVPNNPKSKLMYYLSCINNVLNLDEDGDISHLRDYQNGAYLSEENTHKLLLICALLEPTELINKCIFASDALCGDSSNEFYELSQVNTSLAVANTVVIGGVRKRVQKIMTFKMSWLENNFLEPFKTLTNQMTARQRAEQQRKKSTCIVM